MKERINKIMEAEGLSPAKFADEIGVQRSSISHIISGRNKPSYDFIVKILTRFSGINAEWLITGKGTMIKSDATSIENSFMQPSLFDKSSIDNSETVKKKENKFIGEKERYSLKNPVNAYNSEESAKESSSKKVNVLEKFTDVNRVKYILIFYEDGSFDQFMPR